MAIKKSDLYSKLWQSCDELRGGMDASQYKDYVLFMLFIKYITDKYGDTSDFAPSVVIPRGASFTDMLALRGQSDIGDKINTQVIAPLVDANSRLAHSDFPDFNDPNKLGQGNEMVQRLTNLINIFADPQLDFSQNRAEHDDILGDAYEYLMRHFATQSGKSKGQFYTPAEVSRVIAQVIGISPGNSKASTTAYDPTCGSGSLLLKVAAEAGKQITLEGQEKDVTTAGLARMNMILHGFPTANVVSGNTLTAPQFKDGERLRTYDYVVANPPFSDKTWLTGLTPTNDRFQRFVWGEPPAKQGDYAYLLHIIRSMKGAGKAACVLPHGVLFRGNAEARIREQLVRSGYLKGIIGLPANLFYGTGIPACIVVLDKENAAGRKGVFMLDASKGFRKDGPKNRLREQDIHRIVDTFKRQVDTTHYARMVPVDEIANPQNEFNLNLPRYIDSSEPEDIQDIEGHLRGGIPERDIDELDAYWKVLPTVRGALFESANRPGYLQLCPALPEVKRAILEHSEFAAFRQRIHEVFDGWRRANMPVLTSFGENGHPKELIKALAEDLLAAFGTVPLLDAYDVFQHLMDYWIETMQDDAYQIAADGWVAETYRVQEEVKSGKKKGQMKDKGWACDLVPKSYIVARYFANEQSELDVLQEQLDGVSAILEELQEEHGGEVGVLKNVSTKANAQDAYTEALVAVWNEQEAENCSRYNESMEKANAEATRLRELRADAYIAALKNTRGKVTLKAVRNRLATSGDPQEQSTLENYLAADKTQKAYRKAATELLANAKTRLLDQLEQEPLHESHTDLHATVRYLESLKNQTDLKASVKATDTALDKLAHDKYPQLSVDEIKALIVNDKWMARLSDCVVSEIDRVSQMLTGRARQLAERYSTPLPKLTEQVEFLSARVQNHLKSMGAVRQ